MNGTGSRVTCCKKVFTEKVIWMDSPSIPKMQEILLPYSPIKIATNPKALYSVLHELKLESKKILAKYDIVLTNYLSFYIQSQALVSRFLFLAVNH